MTVSYIGTLLITGKMQRHFPRVFQTKTISLKHRTILILSAYNIFLYASPFQLSQPNFTSFKNIELTEKKFHINPIKTQVIAKINTIFF